MLIKSSTNNVREGRSYDHSAVELARMQFDRLLSLRAKLGQADDDGAETHHRRRRLLQEG